MLERGPQAPLDEYERHLRRHAIEQDRYIHGIDYDDLAPGETIGTIDDY